MRQKHPTRLRDIREATGKLQAQVADELGVSKSTYNSWETGRHELNTTQLAHVATYFGCTPNDILGFGSDAHARFAVLTPQEDALVRLFRGVSPNVRKSIITLLNAARRP